MLDVHVLSTPSSNKAWYYECMRSIEDAVRLAGFPVNVYEVGGIPGDLASARKLGYSKGDSKWKTFVDDDDFLLPHAFLSLRKYLDLDVSAIFPLEVVQQNGRLHGYTQGRHHLPLYTRDFLASVDFSKWVSLIDIAMKEQALRDDKGFLDVDEVVYVHRVYSNSSARVLRKEALEEGDLLRSLYG